MDAPLRVLVVEDSEEDTLLLLRELRQGGYKVSYRRVETSAAMEAALDGESWDVVVADYEMPHFSAPEALKILKESGLDLPFIIVSGKISEDMAVAMMRAGAHDYIAKGNLARLCPAIERELREAAERRERRRSEAALRESEELYRAVVEESSECIFLIDARSTHILEVNDAFRKLLGYTSEELKKMTLYDFVAHDPASIDERIRLIIENSRHDIGERRYRRKDGTFVDVEVRANALLLNGREVICNVSHDITERKLAERRGAAHYAVSCILAESSSLSEATPRLLEEIGGKLGWELGALWMVDQDEGVLRCKEVWHAPSVVVSEFEAVSRETSFVPGRSLPGRVWESESPFWIPNVLEYTDFVRLESAAKEGLHGAFAFPILNQGRVLGVMEFLNRRILSPDENLLRTVATLGNQIGQFIERKWGEETLKESEERYRVVAETASDAIFIIDEDSRVTFVNSAIEEIFGYAAEEVLGERLTMLMPERMRDLHLAGLRRYVETGRRHLNWETKRLIGLHKSGTEIPVEVSFGEFTKGGERFFTGFVRDVTEQVLAEEASRRNEERFRSLIQNASDIITVLDSDGTILYQSPAAERVLGSPFEDQTGTNAFEHLHPDDVEQACSMFDKVLKTPGDYQVMECRVPHADGSWRYLENTVCNLLDDPNVRGIVVNSRDITERRRAEETLKESEERFRATFEQAAVGIAQVALDGRWLRVNQKLCDIVGYSREELLGLTFQDITHPDDLEGDLEQARQLLAGEIDTYSVEKRYVSKDSSIVWINLAASAMRESSGEPKYFIGVIEDITERKRAEETRLRLATIVESSQDAIISKTLDGIITSWNRGAQSIYGYSAEEVVGKPISILAPPERPNEIPYILDKVRRGEPIEHYETVRVKKDGARIDVSITVSPIRDSRGNILGASTIARNITEQKRAEEASKESRDRLRLAVEATGLGTWVFNPITWKPKFDGRAKAMFGLSASAEMSYEVFLERVHPEDRERVVQAVHSSLDPTSGGRYDIEHRTVGAEDGAERWVAARGQAFFDEAGRAVRFIGTVLDITERKEAEEELRRSEERFRRVVEQAADALFVHDLAGRFVDVNRQACESLRYTREELLNMSVSDVEMDFAPGSLERVWRKVESGTPLTIRGNHRRKDGTIFPVEVRLGRFDSEGRPLILVLARDITERQRAEERLQRSLRALLALYEAGQVLGSTLDADEILSELLEIVQHVTVPTAVVISRPDENQRLRVWRAIGLENLPDYTRDTPEVQASLEGTLESGRHQRFRLGRPEEPESLVGICLPLMIQHRYVGLIEVYDSEALLEEDNLEFLGSLVSQAASALENAWLYGELADRERRLHELVGELLMAQEEERRRVAYEVHDSVAQAASAAHQYLQAFVRRFPPVSEKSGKDLEEILKLVRRTVREARRVIAGLRPAVLDDFGLTAALYQEIEELRESGWQVEYEEERGDERLPQAVEVALFRVAQEALTNARKHSQTHQARVELKRQKDMVSLEVRDWGQGFDLDILHGGAGPGKRVGVSGMRERIAMLGGEFELRSRPGEGTLVRVSVPLEPLTEGEEKGGDER